MFAVPVLKPTYSILDWTIQEIGNIGIKTRKVLTMTGNFHINSDVDCLYIPRWKKRFESSANCLRMWNSFLESPSDKK